MPDYWPSGISPSGNSEHPIAPGAFQSGYRVVGGDTPQGGPSRAGAGSALNMMLHLRL